MTGTYDMVFLPVVVKGRTYRASLMSVRDGFYRSAAQLRNMLVLSPNPTSPLQAELDQLDSLVTSLSQLVGGMEGVDE